jgi:hypothetical protein
MIDDGAFAEKVTRGFWITMIACALYALAAWVLTR